MIRKKEIQGGVSVPPPHGLHRSGGHAVKAAVSADDEAAYAVVGIVTLDRSFYLRQESAESIPVTEEETCSE